MLLRSIARVFLAVTLIVGCVVSANPAEAQNADAKTTAAAGERSINYIPEDAVFLADLRPREILIDPSNWMLPTEIIQAWCDQYVGVQVDNIELVRIVSPMLNPEIPTLGMTIEFVQDVALEDLKPGLIGHDDPLMVAGRECFVVGDTDGEIVVHADTPRRWFVGTPNYLPALFNADNNDNNNATSTLIELVRRTPKQGQYQLALDLTPFRPLMMGVVMVNADQIPPAAGRLPELVNLIESITMNADLSGGNLMAFGAYSIWANDDAAADQIEQIIAQTAGDLATMLVSMAIQQVPGDDKVSASIRDYIRRMEREIVPMVRLQRDGLEFTLPNFNVQSVAYIGVLTGLALPAVQSAREAARRMSASNNLKMIGLAIHNYHSAYRKLPPRAITADDGTPLLSWRVAILPFVEQQALYEQFHLDEPWDSPHNLALAAKIPEVYVDPSAAFLGNQTIFQSPYGDGTMLGTNGQQNRFRDVLDGLSNTIMVLEASTDEAVVWTKPEDVTVVSEDPLLVTGDIHPGGFHVLLGDGSVRFFTDFIDQDMFNGMITRAGKEVIDQDF